MQPVQTAFAGFTGGYELPSGSTGFYGNRSISQPSTAFYALDSSSASVYNGDSVSQPWYFDSGATNHITNNMQHLNLDHSPSSALNEGVMVGNANTLQVTHTGKGLLPTPHTTF